jgi:hypothetical protein
MHSFHQSRSRIAFEVLCALTVSASLVAAWMQSGVAAFLPAAAATGFYGLWHLTDMRRPKAAPAVASVPEIEIDEPRQVEASEAAPEVIEAPAKPKKRSRKKAAPAEAEAVDFPDRAEIEEELHAPIAPLFEAKPFALKQRPSFGRKAG